LDFGAQRRSGLTSGQAVGMPAPSRPARRSGPTSNRRLLSTGVGYEILLSTKLLLSTIDGFFRASTLFRMSATPDSETVWFTTKGQIVIPRRFRKEFHIEEGTRAVVTATPEGLLIKPVTSWAIEKGFGLLKRKPGRKSFAEEWAEHKREERELEERKYARSTGA